MKAIPRFREAIAFLKLRHQPAHIKYPLVALQVASNPAIYSGEQLNIKEEVRLANSTVYMIIRSFNFNYNSTVLGNILQIIIVDPWNVYSISLGRGRLSVCAKILAILQTQTQN